MTIQEAAKTLRGIAESSTSPDLQPNHFKIHKSHPELVPISPPTQKILTLVTAGGMGSILFTPGPDDPDPGTPPGQEPQLNTRLRKLWGNTVYRDFVTMRTHILTQRGRKRTSFTIHPTAAKKIASRIWKAGLRKTEDYVVIKPHKNAIYLELYGALHELDCCPLTKITQNRRISLCAKTIRGMLRYCGKQGESLRVEYSTSQKLIELTGATIYWAGLGRKWL